MKIYIEDFVEDLNYRKVILSIGGVDSEKLYSRLKQDCVNHLNRFRGCLENKLMFIENCDLQDVDTDHGYEFGNSLLYLIADEGFSVCPLHYDIDSDRYFIEIDIGVIQQKGGIMQEVIIIIIAIVYFLIGIFASGLIQEEWEKPSMILILLWPLVLSLFILFGVMDAAYDLGKKLKEKLFK